MEVRPARPDEFADILRLVNDPNVDLVPGRVFVAIGRYGQIAAVLPLRLCWIAEPLVVGGASRIESSRAAVAVYRQAEQFIATCATPVLPPRALFAVTRSIRVKRWARRLGWHKLWSGASFFVKHFR